jgi:hypothetical protein
MIALYDHIQELRAACSTLFRRHSNPMRWWRANSETDLVDIARAIAGRPSTPSWSSKSTRRRADRVIRMS